MTEAALAKKAARFIEIKGILDLLGKECAELRTEMIEALGKECGEYYAGAYKLTLAERSKKGIDTKALEAKLGAEIDPFRTQTTYQQFDVKCVGKTAGTLI
jgi:hypothetical protein